MLNISWRYFLFDCSPVIQRFLKAKNLEIQPFIKNNQQKFFIIAPLEFKFWCRRWWFLCFLKWAFGPILTWRITDQIFTIQTKQQIVKLSNYHICIPICAQIQAKTQTKAEIQTKVYCFLLVCRTQTENELMMSAELPTGGHFALIHLTYHQKGRIFPILCNTIQYQSIQCYKLAWDTMQYRY